jgi:amino acid transporter
MTSDPERHGARATVGGYTPVLAAGLEPDAIGVAQDTIIGMTNVAPTVAVGLTLAPLALATAYAFGPVILLTAVPMIIIATVYRRLNMWIPHAGASFEWVGRAINPYLGFLTGWLMITGTLVGAISGVVVLAPSILAIFGTSATSTWPNILISTAVILVMLIIAIVGIRLTARTQVGMVSVECVILIGFAIWGLALVLGHHHGTFPITRSWFSISGIGGKGSLAAGFLIAVFMYTGWDATFYVNEEVKHRRHNPGRAAIMAVALLAIIFTVSEMGMAGVVSPAKLQANASSALVYIAQVMGGSGWAKVMALSLAVSVIGSTGTGIVILARMTYRMAIYRVLPPVLGTVNRRFSTPVIASTVIGLILIAATWVYLLASSVETVFNDVVNVTGLLYIGFYILTALAAMTYYRRRILTNFWDAVLVGILPLAAAGFLSWILVRSLQIAPWSQRWSVIGIVAAGVIMMFVARFVLRSQFFHIARESNNPVLHRAGSGGHGYFKSPARSQQPPAGSQQEALELPSSHIIIRAKTEKAREYAATALRALGFDPEQLWFTASAVSYRISPESPESVHTQLKRTSLDWTVVEAGLDYLLRTLYIEGPYGRQFRISDVPAQQAVGDLAAEIMSLYGADPPDMFAELVGPDRGRRLQLDSTLDQAGVRDRDQILLRFQWSVEEPTLIPSHAEYQRDQEPSGSSGLENPAKQQQIEELLPRAEVRNYDIQLTEKKFDRAALTIIHLAAGRASATLELHQDYYTYYWRSRFGPGEFVIWVQAHQDITTTSIIMLDNTGRLQELPLAEAEATILRHLEGDGQGVQLVLLRFNGPERSWVWQLASDSSIKEDNGGGHTAYTGCASAVHYLRDFLAANEFLADSAVDGGRLLQHAHLLEHYLRRWEDSN